MRRFLWLLTLTVPVAAFAQGAAPPGGDLKTATPMPAAKATEPAKVPANSPANAPAAKPDPAAAGANAPSPATTPAPAATGKKVTVRVPSGSEFTAYIQEAASAAPKTFSDNVDLEVPSDAKTATIYVLDNKSGYAARKNLTAGSIPAEVTFAGPDFKLIQKVKVLATGKDGKPIAGGMVTLTDGGKNATRKVLQASSNGAAEFEFVVSGVGSVSVAPEGGSATTKEVNLGLPANETVQTLEVAMPEITNVIADAAPTGAAAPSGATSTPSATPPTAAAPTAAPPPQQLPPPPSGGFASNLIGWIFLILIIGGAYLYCKKNGITVEMMLRKLGVQPDTVVQGGGSLAGANVAGGVPAPGPPPGPPPIVADPNQCPFCGQMKDASGGCACVVTKGAPPMGGGYAAPSGPAGSGPRLVGVAGAYMGHVFPIMGTAVMGREATNPIPLDRDTTASRRHAQISDAGGAFVLQDLGSSNGTYLNGARVTESALNPGDEVTVGGTRFRFEV